MQQLTNQNQTFLRAASKRCTITDQDEKYQIKSNMQILKTIQSITINQEQKKIQLTRRIHTEL